MRTEDLRLSIDERIGEVTARMVLPDTTDAALVLAHGAGAGMTHPFLESVAERLADRGVATLRYQFPYMDRGGRRPDRAPALISTVRAAVRAARGWLPDVPLFAGGKSMGGRMTSMAAADGGLDGPRGIVFLGFPLHPAGRPSSERGVHLSRVGLPMLFVQGTRDALADLELLGPVCDGLGSAARLHIVDGADHSFRVLKRSGRSNEEALDEVVATAVRWMLDPPERAGDA